MYPADNNYGGAGDFSADGRAGGYRIGNTLTGPNRPAADRPVEHAPDNSATVNRPAPNRPGQGFPNGVDRPVPKPDPPVEHAPDKNRPNNNRPGYNRPNSPSIPGYGGNGPGNSGGVMSKPSSPPPSRVPARAAKATRTVDYNSIRFCMFHFTYVWLRNGVAFWFYPVYTGRHSVSGFRWTNFGWAYTGIDLTWIDYFECV